MYAHLPLLHGPDGKKLSKRHGAASVQELRANGYLPAAVRNYLALLGWGYDESTTFFTTDELIERFSLERVSRNPAVFDEQKLALDERATTSAGSSSTSSYGCSRSATTGTTCARPPRSPRRSSHDRGLLALRRLPVRAS